MDRDLRSIWPQLIALGVGALAVLLAIVYARPVLLLLVVVVSVPLLVVGALKRWVAARSRSRANRTELSRFTRRPAPAPSPRA